MPRRSSFVLAAMIVLKIMSVPWLSMPPPMPITPSAELPLTVELFRVSILPGRVLDIPPPEPSDAELPLTVELFKVSVP